MVAFAAGVQWRPSPNYSSRKGKPAECVVMHYTAGGSATGTCRWFAMRESRVSAHFVIARDGRVYQCVDLRNAAWHAGVAEAVINGESRSDVNRRSIGIELANRGRLHKKNDRFWYESGRKEKLYTGPTPLRGALRFDTGLEVDGYWEPFPVHQLDAIDRLLGQLFKVGYEKAIGTILGHASIGMPLGRKIDPGPAFPWERWPAAMKDQRAKGIIKI